MAIENFRQLAAYNHWANLRLYGAALELPEEAYRRSDRRVLRQPAWHAQSSAADGPDLAEAIDRQRRASGSPRRDPARRPPRSAARPDRGGCAAERCGRRLYRRRSHQTGRLSDEVGQSRTTSRCRISCCILFNHQTHHRGQAHACCLDPDRQRAAVARPVGVSARRARAEIWGEAHSRGAYSPDGITARNSTPCRRIVGAMPKWLPPNTLMRRSNSSLGMSSGISQIVR